MSTFTFVMTVTAWVRQHPRRGATSPAVIGAGQDRLGDQTNQSVERRGDVKRTTTVATAEDRTQDVSKFVTKMAELAADARTPTSTSHSGRVAQDSTTTEAIDPTAIVDGIQIGIEAAPPSATRSRLHLQGHHLDSFLQRATTSIPSMHPLIGNVLNTTLLKCSIRLRVPSRMNGLTSL